MQKLVAGWVSRALALPFCLQRNILKAMPSSGEAAEIASRAPPLTKAEFAGPLSFDLAISPEAASIKGIEGPVYGMADGLVVPDIVSGNILFKSLVWCGGGLARG